MKPLHFAVTLAVCSAPLFAYAQGETGGSAPPPPPPPPANTTTAPPPAPPPPPAEKGQKETGFVFETHVYSQLVSFGVGLGTTLNLPLLTGGIFGGYKLDRLIVGLGFDFNSYDAGGAQIVMRWIPGIRYALIRSSDERVELYGQADLGFGHNFGTSASNEIIDANLGLGARYWAHRQFAVGAVGGWTSEWQLTQSPDTSVVIMGIFAGLQLTGVF